MTNVVKKSALFARKPDVGAASLGLNNCKNPNCNNDKFVIEDFQNQDQGEEANNNLVVQMDKSRRKLNFSQYSSLFFCLYIDTGFAFSQEENIEMTDIKRMRF